MQFSKNGSSTCHVESSEFVKPPGGLLEKMQGRHTMLCCCKAALARVASATEFVYPRSKITGGLQMAFYAFYVVAIIVLILHFTGWLKRNNLEWLVLALAVAVFPVVIFLR